MGSGSSAMRSPASQATNHEKLVPMIDIPTYASGAYPSPPPSPGGPAPAPSAGISFIDHIDEYGTYKFKGAEAAKWLKSVGAKPDLIESSAWTKDRKLADQVAAAVVEWAKSKNATMATHWFQPLGSAGLRVGQTGQVHNAMFNFGSDGKAKFVFDGGDLLKGETDGSSYMNGGLRATHTAGGYTALDATSPIFIRGDTVFIPTVFVSFHGDALDEKTPLLKSMAACNRECKRLMKHVGFDIGNESVIPNIGLEQEFFLIPRDAYYKRPDLQFTGRTLMGALPARGQELCDHYMAPLNQAALVCMTEMQHEAFKMGIPLKTRHREVAPNQYECAPFFGIASAQIDENLMVMQLMEEIAIKHNLAALLHEKPFAGVNGSGKHNNFSLGTTNGINLFNGPQITEKSGKPELFPILMAATVRAIDIHGDLMRMSIAAPGNDFRLGACEAPPAIISTYLGEQLTNYLEEFKKGNVTPYAPSTKTVDLGIDAVAPFTVPAEDRNRTSPFPYGGHRFEFRACGSSQNVSLINTVLCSILADSFKDFSEKIESGADPKKVAAEALEAHWKCIFNGNGYSAEWPIEAGNRGVWRIDSGVESMSVLKKPKNTELFEKLGVMAAKETIARADVMHEQYAGIVEMEGQCVIDMIKQHVLPAAKAGEASLPSGVLGELEAAEGKIKAKLSEMHSAADEEAKATIARVLRLEVLEEIRVACDKAEAALPSHLWTLATYKELLFLDSHQGTTA